GAARTNSGRRGGLAAVCRGGRRLARRALGPLAAAHAARIARAGRDRAVAGRRAFPRGTRSGVRTTLGTGGLLPDLLSAFLVPGPIGSHRRAAALARGRVQARPGNDAGAALARHTRSGGVADAGGRGAGG